MGRAPCCDKSKVKRGPWSPEEDNILKDYVDKHGTSGSWIALPHKAGLKRCGKSCRLRWLNYLRPNIKHGGFTDEEDSVILTLFRSIGSRWSVIASQLPGRTDNDVKNYWNTKLKKKLLTPPPAAATAAGNFITSTNNTYITNSNKFDNSHEELVVPPNGYEHGFLPTYSQCPVSTSFCVEDDAFLAEWGSDELMPYHQLLNVFDFQEGPTADYNQHDNFNFGYFDAPNISSTHQIMHTIYQSLANELIY